MNLDQDDSLGQVQGHSPAVSGLELLLQVHLEDLSGQPRFQLLFPGIPLGEPAQVSPQPFRSRTRERVASDLHAQGIDLAQPGLQGRIMSPQHGVALRGQYLGRDGFPPQHQFASSVDGIGRVAEVLQSQGQESIKLAHNRIEERNSLPLGANREDLSHRPIIDGRSLFHQGSRFRGPTGGRVQPRQVVQAFGKVRVVLAQGGCGWSLQAPGGQRG